MVSEKREGDEAGNGGHRACFFCGEIKEREGCPSWTFSVSCLTLNLDLSLQPISAVHVFSIIL